LLHCLPSVTVLRKHTPDAVIHWLTSPLYQPLLQATGLVDHVWGWQPKSGWAAYWQVYQTLHQYPFDTVINLHPSFKTTLLGALLHPKQQATYHKQKMKTKGVGQRLQTRRHAIQDFFMPFQQVLPLASNLLQPPVLSVSALPALAEWPWQQTLQKTGQKNLPVKHIAIVPGVGAKRSNRAWPEAACLNLIQALLERHADVDIVLIGGLDEVPLAERLTLAVQQSACQHSSRLFNAVGKYTILETASILSLCHVVIGGDTGPIHLAAAVGVPVVSLYGPTSIHRTAPVGNNSVKNLTPPEQLDCWPCEQATCPYPNNDTRYLACMTTLDVQQVIQAVVDQIQVN
jgi:ADP-heptose:LPS heptosyltransferase